VWKSFAFIDDFECCAELARQVIPFIILQVIPFSPNPVCFSIADHRQSEVNASHDPA
jgi:hypothetical protein